MHTHMRNNLCVRTGRNTYKHTMRTETHIHIHKYHKRKHVHTHTDISIQTEHTRRKINLLRNNRTVP